MSISQSVRSPVHPASASSYVAILEGDGPEEEFRLADIQPAEAARLDGAGAMPAARPPSRSIGAALCAGSRMARWPDGKAGAASEPVASSKPDAAAPRPDPSEDAFLRRAENMFGVYKFANEMRTFDCSGYARKLSACLVVVEEGGARVVVTDFAKLGGATYEHLFRAMGKVLGFAGMLDRRANELGRPAYVVRWVDRDDRDRFFPHAWPHGAPMTPFQADWRERADMVRRVAQLLKVGARSAEQVTEKLLGCFGSVMSTGQNPRELFCIDLRPMQDVLRGIFGARRAATMMATLRDHASALLRDRRSGLQWSPRFVNVRVIV